MYSKLQLTKKYLHYYFNASNGRGHGIHSPFVFEFVQHVLNDKRHFYAYSFVEYLRSQLLKDKTIIEVEDLGAGSTIAKSRNRPISDIAKHAAKNRKLGQLLFRIANYYQPKTMVELGTSLGISASYLASACPNSVLTTIEGSASIASIANHNFQFLGLKNIQLLVGNFDDLLPIVLSKTGQVDLAFIDGNHRKTATIDYFEQLLDRATEASIFIFDDIHWSSEMEQAWDLIKKSEKVRLTIDLFFIGIVFFKKNFKEKQDFVIHF